MPASRPISTPLPPRTNRAVKTASKTKRTAAAIRPSWPTKDLDHNHRSANCYNFLYGFRAHLRRAGPDSPGREQRGRARAAERNERPGRPAVMGRGYPGDSPSHRGSFAASFGRKPYGAATAATVPERAETAVVRGHPRATRTVSELRRCPAGDRSGREPTPSPAFSARYGSGLAGQPVRPMTA